MPHYTRENTQRWIGTEGLEHYLAAKALARGVLVLTGHLGAWELSSFYHSLMGHPMGLVIRRLDNRKLDEFVNSIRCMHGNRVLHKDDFARGLLTAMHEGSAVGILMDTNMTPPQGEFVKFLRYHGLYSLGPRSRCPQNRRRRRARLHVMGARRKEICSSFRPATALHRNRKLRSRCSRRHAAMQRRTRVLDPPLSRSVALDSSTLEDAPSRRAPTLLIPSPLALSFADRCMA